MSFTNIVYESVRGVQTIGIDDEFLRQRSIFLSGEVNDDSCNEMIKKLIYLESEDNSKPITIYINSPGGDVTSGLQVYDTIRLLKSPVYGVVTGIAASMGSIIFLACDRERRLMLPNSRVMVHDCSFGHREVGGMKPFELEEQVAQLKKVNERLVKIIAERTGKTVREISKVTKHDSYYDANEAVAFGFASKIIDSDCLSSLLKKGE